MRELAVFALVGIVATLTHYVSALFYIEWFQFSVLQGNFLAYCTAMAVSYIGHARLTFKAAMSKSSLLRFIVVAVLALSLSQLILWVFTELAWFGHRINLLAVVAFVPFFSFLMNKYWVYRKPSCA